MAQLSEKTLTTYRSTINSLYKKIGLGDKAPVDDGSWIKTNFTKITEYIDGMTSAFSRKNNYAILKVWCTTFEVDDKEIIDIIDKQMNDLADAVKKTYATNEMSDKVASNWVGVDDMREKVAYLKAKLPNIDAIDTYKEYTALMRYLCLLIHIEIPLRNDLADSKLVNELPVELENDVNYLVITKGNICLHLNNYKTKKEYGSKVIPFSKELSKEIIKYSGVIKRMSPYDWFIGKNGENAPISRPSYTKLLNKIFKSEGKSVSSTQIRRAVVSDLHKVGENEYKEKQQLADVMCHGVGTASLVYAKVLSKK